MWLPLPGILVFPSVRSGRAEGFWAVCGVREGDLVRTGQGEKKRGDRTPGDGCGRWAVCTITRENSR